MQLLALFPILISTLPLISARNIPRAPRDGFPQPYQANITPECTSFYKVQQGDNCYELVVNRFKNFTFDEFYAWNPDVATERLDCSNLLLNYWVCVGVNNKTTPPTTTSTPLPTATCTGTAVSTPTPTQPGMVQCCKKFYKVIENDTCVLVETKFKITDADFRKWNPSIDKDCFNLLKDHNVCVGM
ncbi:carbohydrate-binding module family 50 protein [Zopfia rhizophila CBS 207.26]|uniref:Carbohydrate-binding module family 50 protein n=1 Tax=Zopfia rhizophila CBS 207.26 TaxID=1314779 RepID=A0A6A6E5B1_9PEZI|nr:carbohydrate-binding module family 50 protein [Zopfia rhizophila CBS 207.26]